MKAKTVPSLAAIKANLLVQKIKPAYPVNVQWFANQVFNKPVVIYEWNLDDRCCAVIIDKPYYECINIGVNKKHPVRKQRFGIFHEMAHICLGHKGDLNFIDEEEDPVLRKEADDFATEILMPQQYILQLAAKTAAPLQLIRHIYFNCQVSFEAACRRVVELGLYQGMFLMFNFKQIYFLYSSPDFSPSLKTLRQILQPDCSVMPNGKTIQREILYHGEVIMLHLCRFKTTGTFLAALVEDNPRQRYDFLVRSWLSGISGSQSPASEQEGITHF